jgi:hypothetical protein
MLGTILACATQNIHEKLNGLVSKRKHGIPNGGSTSFDELRKNKEGTISGEKY